MKLNKIDALTIALLVMGMVDALGLGLYFILGYWAIIIFYLISSNEKHDPEDPDCIC